jgi:hypothetical protein
MNERNEAQRRSRLLTRGIVSFSFDLGYLPFVLRLGNDGCLVLLRRFSCLRDEVCWVGSAVNKLLT